MGVALDRLRPGPRVRSALRLALDLALPPQALDDGVGGQPVLSPGMTPEHWSRIAFISAPFCDGCGAPFDYDRGEGALCPACMTRRPAFQRARAACLYDEHSRDLILKLKHADDGWIIYSVMKNGVDDNGDFTDMKDDGLAPPRLRNVNPAPSGEPE